MSALPKVPVFLAPHQMTVIRDLVTRHIVMGCGLGSGKTHTCVRKAHDMMLRNPNSAGWYINPDYSLSDTVSIPAWVEYLESIGWREGVHYKFRSVRQEKVLQYMLPGMTAEAYFKSANNWKRFVGKELAWTIFEEPAHAPKEAFLRVNDRLRCPLARTPHQAVYAGTPDIVMKDPWYYDLGAGDMFERLNKQGKVRVVQAATDANPYRRAGYIHDLFDLYGHNKNLIRCYVFGQFVLIADGVAAENFSESNICNHKTRADNKIIHMNWDFNVGQTYWCAAQIERDDEAFITDECEKQTPGTYDGVQQFIAKYPPYKRNGDVHWREHKIYVEGDASGYQSDTTSKHLFDSDYDLIVSELRQHYSSVEVVAPRSNPYIRRRIEASNRGFSKQLLKIDCDCRLLEVSLRRTTRDDLMKKKSGSHDTWTHPFDAMSYFYTHNFPIEGLGQTEQYLIRNY